jgi:NADP-dependent 3-hydroxy acid dehydrogenase YdfG
MMKLTNQTALIAGASGGIGRAVACALAEAGAKVVLVGRNREKLEATRALLGPAAASALVAPADVTDRSQVGSMVQTVLATCGAIDILIYAAGLNVSKRSLRSLDPADWDRLIAVNLTGAYNLVHFVLPSMRDRGKGLVIQISSVSALRVSPIAGPAYSASKAAQAVLARCIAREERGRDIRSTVIYSGEVNTAFLDARANRMDGVDAARREMILQPADIGALVRFLAELPPRVHIPELVMKPTIDDYW